MVEVLEKTAERSSSVGVPEKRDYLGKGVSYNKGYSTFAEMYLEKPEDIQAGLTCTVCTWRGIPTIDDW